MALSSPKKNKIFPLRARIARTPEDLKRTQELRFSSGFSHEAIKKQTDSGTVITTDYEELVIYFHNVPIGYHIGSDDNRMEAGLIHEQRTFCIDKTAGNAVLQGTGTVFDFDALDKKCNDTNITIK